MNSPNIIILSLSIAIYIFYELYRHSLYKSLPKEMKNDLNNQLSYLRETEHNKKFKLAKISFKIHSYYQIFAIFLFIIYPNDRTAEACIWPLLALTLFNLIWLKSYKSISDEWISKLSPELINNNAVEKLIKINTSHYFIKNIGIYGLFFIKLPSLFRDES